jgi:hypothetical protein
LPRSAGFHERFFGGPRAIDRRSRSHVNRVDVMRHGRQVVQSWDGLIGVGLRRRFHLSRFNSRVRPVPYPYGALGSPYLIFMEMVATGIVLVQKYGRDNVRLPLRYVRVLLHLLSRGCFKSAVLNLVRPSSVDLVVLTNYVLRMEYQRRCRSSMLRYFNARISFHVCTVYAAGQARRPCKSLTLHLTLAVRRGISKTRVYEVRTRARNRKNKSLAPPPCMPPG